VCGSVLQCVAVCCSVLRVPSGATGRGCTLADWLFATSFGSEVRCSALQCVAVCCSTLQCVAVRCSVLQCVAVCCSVLSGATSHSPTV